MKNIFNLNKYLGASVHCVVRGNGTISELVSNSQDYFTVRVTFSGGSAAWYAQDGRNNNSHLYPTLSFGHKEYTAFDYNVPKEPLLDKSQLTEITCWVTNWNECFKKRKAINPPVAIVGVSKSGDYLDNIGQCWKYAWKVGEGE